MALGARATFTNDSISLIKSSFSGLFYYNQPAVVVRKITYYEPELVAVVVEKGVDDVPEESYIIQNYADVLSSGNEIHLCAADDASKCLDKPVTKLLVPSVFKGIRESGFQDFFKHAQQVPWVSTINNNLELVKPVISLKGDLQRKRREDAPEIVAKPDNISPLKVPSQKQFPLKEIIQATIEIMSAIAEASQKGDQMRKGLDDKSVVKPEGVSFDHESETTPEVDKYFIAKLKDTSTEDPILRKVKFPLTEMLKVIVSVVQSLAEAQNKGN